MSIIFTMFVIKKVKKKIGEFSGSQMEFEGRHLIPRVPIDCDEANESEYELWKEGPFFIHIMNPIYFIFCKNCGERLELDPEEYFKIVKIVRLNKKFQIGKIDSEEHFIRLTKLKGRLRN